MQRPDVVAVCSNECRRGRVAESGTLPGAKYGEHVFAGLKKRYSGYLHRASMTVDVTDPPLQQTIYRKDAEQKQGRIVYRRGVNNNMIKTTGSDSKLQRYKVYGRLSDLSFSLQGDGVCNDRRG